jgi:hypothetical protein
LSQTTWVCAEYCKPTYFDSMIKKINYNHNLSFGVVKVIFKLYIAFYVKIMQVGNIDRLLYQSNNGNILDSLLGSVLSLS